MTIKTIINDIVISGYEPLSIPITIDDNDTLYYLGVNTKAQGYEEVVVKYEPKTNKMTTLKKVIQGNRKIITILFIESKLHAIIFDISTIICELVELSEDNGNEISIKRFEKLDFGVEKNTDFYEAFNNNDWSYDTATYLILGGGGYYNYINHQYYDFDISLSLKDGKATLIIDSELLALNSHSNSE